MRVIAGSARGRPLRAPRGAATRPTADLIKGVIFSILEAEAYKRGFTPDEAGRLAAGQAWPRVLDLFAGTGALGIEALSRGAEHADFVEEDPEAARTIRANLEATGLAERGRVHRQAARLALPRLRGPVDLAFVDPPYGDQLGLTQTLEGLARSGLLTPSSLVVLEQARASAPPPSIGPLGARSSRAHGRTRVTVYARAPSR